MSIKKKYLKTKPVCKITFSLVKEETNAAKSVFLVGDFNKWDTTSLPMKKLKNGTFTQTIDLEQGKEYQFRYFTDNNNWLNDSEADKLTPNSFGDSENSVIVL